MLVFATVLGGPRGLVGPYSNKAGHTMRCTPSGADILRTVRL